MLYKSCRSPRFIAEKRAQFDSEDQGVRVRGARRGHNLPNNWDDELRDFGHRSWKRYRKTQFK